MIDLASFIAEGDGAKIDHFSSSIISTDAPATYSFFELRNKRKWRTELR
jgi:hypothetical protein